jgi:hypothetical protein
MKKGLLAELMLAAFVFGFGIATLKPAFDRTRIRHLASQVLEDARALDGALTEFRAANPSATNVSLPMLLPFLDPEVRVAISSGQDIFGRYYEVGPLIADAVRISPETCDSFPEALVPQSIWAGYR